LLTMFFWEDRYKNFGIMQRLLTDHCPRNDLHKYNFVSIHINLGVEFSHIYKHING
jgi:hypothetical protein